MLNLFAVTRAFVIIPAAESFSALVTPLQRCHACARRSAPGAPVAGILVKAAT